MICEFSGLVCSEKFKPEVVLFFSNPKFPFGYMREKIDHALIELIGDHAPTQFHKCSQWVGISYR